MDICPSCGKSVSCVLSSFDDQRQCTCRDVEDKSIEDLGDTLNESFHIEDAQNEKHLDVPHKDDINHVDNGISDGELKIFETEPVPVASQKCFCRCKTIPPSSKMSSCSAFSDEGEESGSKLQENSSAEYSCTTDLRTMALPTPLKLVSAMKGSRERQGMEPKKLTVTWAPDVYDPRPTSLSHVPKSKGQQRSKNNNKKNGKNKQKGKASRGSGSKDKKQFRKISANSDLCYKSLDARDRLVYHDDFGDPDEMEFVVGSPDPYCGSSFLKKSLGKVHMSVAEAL
ncbi:uncharacterized protein LOC131159168 isoform X2 [Malania oleifera]|uniref:uncharacterized protein LOC131159168 isoform X2 n=1 Tax=Malania oleifera TaxID=397392 RepID=UPI0025AE2C1C|nr:uncharacterized protein LOC131159168 isoform X2 [Malania oleifera]